MVREIIKDTEVLTQVSTKASIRDEYTYRVIEDLIDTANAHKDRCVGLAAIQIGEPVRIIVVFNGTEFIPLVNPVIVGRFGKKYMSEEGCMSIDGTRQVERFEEVVVMHQAARGIKKFRCVGFAAKIIQHEVDHLNGKLI